MPLPQTHAALSPVAYAVARAAGVGEPAVASAASVLIDIDHFVDLVYCRRTGRRDRQLIPLHSVELALALLLFGRSRRRRMQSVAIGFLTHLATDCLLGEYRIPHVFVIYRLRKGMRTGRTGDWVLWPRGPHGWTALFDPAAVRET